MNRLLLIPLVLFVFSCGDKEEDKYLEIEYSSIQNGETLYGNGLIIKFSEPLDLNQFDNLYFFPNYNTSLIKIDSSEYFMFNGNYLNWVIYDSSNYTCAFFEVTNEWFPNGTGEGMGLQEQNEFLINKNIKSLSDRNLKTDFSLSFF